MKNSTQLDNICLMQNGPDSKGKNDIYFRFWYEVDQNKLKLDGLEFNERFTWFPLNKGGNIRWYGLNIYIARKEFCNNSNF